MEDASQVIETIMSNSAGEQDFPVLFDDESILSDGERNAKAPKPEYYPFPVLATRFPQIAKRVEIMWGHRELDAYLNKLIIDERGKTPMVCVADRSNSRLQYFTLDGRHSHFVGNTNLPCHFSIRNGKMLIPDLAARITLFDEKNQLIAHLGEGPENWRALRVKTRDNFPPGKFVSPHGGMIDHKGDIYIVEWVEVGRVTKLRHVS